MNSLSLTTPTRPAFGSWKNRKQLARALVHAALVLGSTILLAPLVWMFSTSLKDMDSVFTIPPQWIPDPAHWGNYLEIFRVVPFGRYLLNTSLITVLDVTGKVFSCSLVAFAFARLRWRGRDTLFIIMLATLMLPHQVTLIPQFLIFTQLGWVNTYLPLIVPSWLGGPLMTFLMRQYFLTIPIELDESARIDGASLFDVYWRIILPQARPALLSVGIFTFQASWNDFMGPLIYLQDQQLYTISLGLRTFQDQFQTQWHLLMGASLLAMVPVIVLFFVAQKYFMQGIVFTGIKG